MKGLMASFVLIFIASLCTTTNSKMAWGTNDYYSKTPLTSSWGSDYDLLQSKITGVTIISDFYGTTLSSSDFLYGTTAELYDDVFPSGPAFVLEGGAVTIKDIDGNTQNLEKCIVFNRTESDGFIRETAEGAYYKVTLDAKYEIYMTRMVFGTDWPGLTWHPGAEYNMPRVTLPQFIEELYVEMTDEKTSSTVRWYGGSSSGNLPSSYSGNQLSYPSVTEADFISSDWVFPNIAAPYNGLPIKDDFTMWESELPSVQTDAPITNEVTFYIGQKNKGKWNFISFALCELQIYGSLITESPTSDPTMNPVAPSGSPTLAPSNAPSATPTAAPSASPTEDACPNFDIQQPCCASSGGYEFVNYTYNKLNDQIVDEAAIESTCVVSIKDADCCGNGAFIPANPVTANPQELRCTQGGTDYVGIDNVCDVKFLVEDPNGIYFGFEGVNGTNTEYANLNFAAVPQTYDCSCDYVVNICEIRSKLTCIGSNAPYTNEYDLCATQSAFDDVFVGGGETDIISYASATLNGQSCLCNYVGDNCLDDVDKRDNFDEVILDDNDPCTVSFIRDCCLDSELSFGGVAISSLNLSLYLELDAVNTNNWGCLNGIAFCDGSDVPQFTDTKQSHFSWVYNEFGPNDGFDSSSMCQCLIEYNNCTTSAPTPDTNAPSSDPTMFPSLFPTQSPTEYAYDEFVQAIANQPCCNGVNGTSFDNGSCADNTAPLCELDNFDGESSLIEFVENIISGSECTCRFNVGYWDWPINTNPNYISLDAGIWTKILTNITWQSPLTLRNTKRRRLLDIDTGCYDMYVSECDVTECVSSPFTSNSSYFLNNIGQTFEYWTDNALQIEHCHCYWLYDLCLTGSPTSDPTLIPTNVPTQNPIATATTKKNPTISTTELGDEQGGNSDGFVDDAVTLITDNYIYSGAAAVGILCACCFLCILCIHKRKQKNAEKTKEQMKVSADRKQEKQDTAYQEVTPETPRDGVNDTQIEMEQPSPMDKVTSSSVVDPIVASTPPPKMADPQTPMIAAAAVANEDVDKKVDEELVGDDLYFITFTQKPFGVTFGKNDNDKRNLFVNAIDSEAAGYEEGVILGSYIAKLEKEVVEGLGAKKIFKIFKNKYADVCPLKITFRKPLEEINVTPNPPSPPQPVEENEDIPEPPAPPVNNENNEEVEYDENDEDYEYYDEEEEENYQE